MINVTIEFYDKNGLILHSGFYEPIRTFKARDTHHAVRMMTDALEVFGMLYSESKTVTLRCDVPQKLFPITLDLRNPHYEGGDNAVA